MSDNELAYSLVAGVKTAQIDSTLDISENWWGTTDYIKIKRQIFDFDNWNDHAVANFRPFLIEDDFDSSVSVSILFKKNPSLVKYYVNSSSFFLQRCLSKR